MIKNYGKQLVAVILTLAMIMVISAAIVYAAEVTADSSNQSYSDSSSGGHAVLINGKTVTLTNPTITKTGDSSSEDADFTGINAAVLAENGATLTLKGGTVTTGGSHANGVFSYGTGTTVNVSDMTIKTTSNNSGGIMTTGGGTTNATNLTVTTTGNSSAPIRSDRGGGTVTVTGGSYTSSGVGSPAIYSTAAISVSGATLTTSASEAVVVEGSNSVTLTNCTVNGNNTTKNGQSTTYKNVMLYQSMSGDASSGGDTFTMTGGSMVCKTGDMFYVTNQTSTINLSGATLTGSSDGNLLTAAAGSWGTSGSNGGKVTMNADSQTLSGAISVDSISSLTLNLKNGSAYTGAINTSGQKGTVAVSVPSGTTWTLDADSYVSSLTDGGTINTNGHTLYVNGTAYAGGSTTPTPSPSTTVTPSPSPSATTASPVISYTVYGAKDGWSQGAQSDGATAGTTGQSQSIQAFKANVVSSTDGSTFTGLGVKYDVHVQNQGWKNAWPADGTVAGSTTAGLQIEAIKLSLTGDLAGSYDIYYRVHAANVGWMAWAKDGSSAGTTGFGNGVEAIQVKLVAKDAGTPAASPANATDQSFLEAKTVSFVVHGQNYGWNQGWQSANQLKTGTAGTTGQGLRLEAIQIADNNAAIDLAYSVHVQDVGWMTAVSEGQTAGTTGQGLRLEAIRIWKTGTAASSVTYQYRVHVQNQGWGSWVTAGTSEADAPVAGTEGQGLRIEAIQFRVSE